MLRPGLASNRQDPAFDYKIVNKNADNNLAIPGHVLLLFSSIR